MKVLSLFDGISCGRLALERAGIPVEKYYASEIDKYAIQIAQKNYPDTIQLGDVTKLNYLELLDVDLVIGGSPCQGFSFAGKQLNFNDPRSKLFFEFVRAVKTIKPKYFLLENVKMKQEFQDIISEQLGVRPIEINSSLVSAQNRKRLYWTNIPNVTVPADKGILLKDILHEFVDNPIDLCDYAIKKYKEFYDKNGFFPLLFNPYNCTEIIDKAPSLTAQGNSQTKSSTVLMFEWLNKYIVPFDKTLEILDKEVAKGKVGYFGKDSQANRVYYIHDKAVTLCGEAGGGAAKMGQYLIWVVKRGHGARNDSIDNESKMPTITSNSWEQNNHLLFGCITPDRVEKRQNGQRFNDGQKFYTLTAQDRHGVLVEGYIRKLTPVECERLQTLPDGWTGGVSDSQRYKALGNGWTVDVIAHIFGGLK